MLFSFRAYAYFCQCKFLNALNDLNSLAKLGFSFDTASQYNMFLLQGISHAQNNMFAPAIASFTAAEQARKEFSDPIIYKSLTKISEYNRNPKTKDRTLLNEALQFIIRALAKEDNSNSHYLCAAILYTMESCEEALEHIEEAIKKSDDHVIKHFYLRGLIHGSLEKNRDAYVDFSNVLSLGKELRDKEESEDGEK